MRRLYIIAAVVFALMASAAVLTANAAYPADPGSDGNTGGVVFKGEQWASGGFHHPLAKLPQSGLRNSSPGTNLRGDAPPSWGTDIRVSADNVNRPHNEMA